MQYITSESIKVPKFHNENYCRMTSDPMDDVQEDVLGNAESGTGGRMSGGCKVVVPMISNKYQTNIKLISKL